MARRTKEEAELTRQQLLDAARHAFAERGVSRTSLEHIACAAGVTRGAVYWHFANKVELFFAMLDQVTIPILATAEDPNLSPTQADPLLGITRFLSAVFQRLDQDEQTRQVFEIISNKCEMVAEFSALLERFQVRLHSLTQKLTLAYARAAAMNQLKPGLDPTILALETSTFFNGLFKMWLVDQDGTLVRNRIQPLILTHMALRARDPQHLDRCLPL